MAKKKETQDAEKPVTEGSGTETATAETPSAPSGLTIAKVAKATDKKVVLVTVRGKQRVPFHYGNSRYHLDVGLEVKMDERHAAVAVDKGFVELVKKP